MQQPNKEKKQNRRKENIKKKLMPDVKMVSGPTKVYQGHLKSSFEMPPNIDKTCQL